MTGTVFSGRASIGTQISSSHLFGSLLTTSPVHWVRLKEEINVVAGIIGRIDAIRRMQELQVFYRYIDADFLFRFARRGLDRILMFLHMSRGHLILPSA